MSKRISINPNLIELDYAVRGKIPQRAAEMEREGRSTIPCNIGNPQALGQKPITFYRQVLSLLEYPTFISRERTIKNQIQSETVPIETFSDTILDYADEFLGELKTGTGAYTESKGPLFIREAISNFIDKRDGADVTNGQLSNPDNIFLTNGASDAVRRILEILITDKNDGIMIPIPQYPLYSATIKRSGGTQINYYPDEDMDWLLNEEILEESFTEAEKFGIKIR